MAQCITKLAEQNDYPKSFIDEVKGWQIAYVNERFQTVTFIVRTCVVSIHCCGYQGILL